MSLGAYLFLFDNLIIPPSLFYFLLIASLIIHTAIYLEFYGVKNKRVEP